VYRKVQIPVNKPPVGRRYRADDLDLLPARLEAKVGTLAGADGELSVRPVLDRPRVRRAQRSEKIGGQATRPISTG
jgi:hypothetical protein